MIDVRDLRFTYPGASCPAVQGHSFKVEDGEVFGFLGPSGAGKSTTQNILIGLLHGWSGDIEILGRSLHRWGSEYYRKIGVSFELPNHYLKLTARENLDYFRALYGCPKSAVEEVLGLVGLSDEADKPVAAFSKGMKNRLNFARSLLHRPQVWFLDEPTSGLDPVNAVRIRDLIRQRRSEGVTTLLTTHDMHTAQSVCDRVAFIVEGKIAVVDTPDALRQRFGRREVEVGFEDGSRSCFPLDELATDDGFLAALKRPGLATIHSQESSLEDVFVQVTGRSLA